MKKIGIIVFLFFSFASLKAQEDYWQDVDFGDTTLIHSRFLTEKLVGFLYQTSFDGEESHFDSLTKNSLDVILDKAKVNMKMYGFVLEYLLNGYSNMGKSQIVDYLLTYPRLMEGEISMEEGLCLDSITEPFQRVKVGAKAPDFSGVTIDGKSYHLYESTAKNILVVFWSTDCEYCHDFLNAIRKHLDLKSDYELVTFALAENQGDVRSNVQKMRLHGYHFYDSLRWESKPFLDYHVTSTPTVFLLDEEKNIVCKPYDWMELKLYINEKKRIKNR